MGTEIVVRAGIKLVDYVGEESIKQIALRFADVILENPKLLNTIFVGSFSLAGLKMLRNLELAGTNPDGSSWRFGLSREGRAA